MPDNQPASATENEAQHAEPLPDFFSFEPSDAAPMFSVIWGDGDSEDLRFRTIIPYIAVEGAEYDRQKGIITIYAGLRRVVVECTKRLDLLQKRKEGAESPSEESQTPDDMLDKLETHHLASLFTDREGGVKVEIILTSDEDDPENGDGFGSD